MIFPLITKCDGSDGRAAASYPKDQGLNLAVSGSIFDPLHVIRCIKSFRNGRTTEYHCTWLMITQMYEWQK